MWQIDFATGNNQKQKIAKLVFEKLILFFNSQIGAAMSAGWWDNVCLQETHGSLLNCLFSVYLLIIQMNTTVYIRVCLTKHIKIKEILVYTCTVITPIFAHELTLPYFLFTPLDKWPYLCFKLTDLDEVNTYTH